MSSTLNFVEQYRVASLLEANKLARLLRYLMDAGP